MLRTVEQSLARLNTELAFGLLGGGTLTGKFNQPGETREATRVKQASEKQIALADVVTQIVDNLGALEFALTAEQLKRLAGANPLPELFPHTFWNDFVRRDLIFGENANNLER